ncbi:E3 ubiquitin-protein ligase TRIM39-like isoform X2 [Sinocyclocheilus rhinocerous]|uniref:E3 ubiquitin-protein ligase TRIM39-like isoform X2 n=1 Tax=Sinocyclocheilus rhinocerous TaxID=307959 RepID=UPI0007BA2A22|nr:PREDICTED: E3 ubiquitin-protein ligase TRIM39-like isoform X2 [Sinocyclocheilus rhinocerous]
MVITCAVRGCRSHSSNGIKVGFFRIPRVRTREGEETRTLCERRRATWLARINRSNVKISDGCRVCSDHFVQGRPSYLHDEKNPDWAPSLKLEVKDAHSQTNLSRYQRAKKRPALGNRRKDEKLVVDTLLEAAAVNQGPEQPCISTEESEVKARATCDSVSCKSEFQTATCDANTDSALLISTDSTETKESLKAQIKALREKLRISQEFQQTLHQTAECIKLLSNEEAARIKALREEEEQKSQILRKKIEKMRKEMSSISATIAAVEEEMKAEDALLLQNYDATLKRVSQCKAPDPEDISGVLINVPKHLSNLKFTVLQKMQKTVDYTPVTFDPNTAHCNLILSEDLTSVRYSDEEQTLPENPERFDMFACVLGSEGFDSGSHCWDVEVGDSTGWFLGVMTESAQRRNKIFSRSGIWLVGHFCGEYKAHEPPQSPALLPVKEKLQRIRVQLDWDSGELSFSDPLTDTHMHSFTHTFTERLFPFFGVGCDISPLLILPVNSSVKKDLP